MATYCDISEEYAVIHGLDQNITLAYLTTDTGIILDVATNSAYFVCAETATLDDEASFKADSTVIESATLDDTVVQAMHGVTVTADAAVTGSSVISAPTDTLTETGQIDDSATTSIYTLVTEVGGLGEDVTASTVWNWTLIESARLDDALAVPNGSDAEESAVLGSAAFGSLASGATVTNDVAVLGSTVDEDVRGSSLLLETAVLGDSTQQSLTGSNSANELAYLHGAAVVRSGRAAWVTHVRQLAMSRYENLNAAEIVMVGGKAIGVGPNGVSVFTPTAGVGASILTGKRDFGTPAYKRMESLYACGEAESPLQLDVTVDDRGNDVTYEYSFQPRQNGNTRNNRVIVGKGMRSRFYQYKFSNPDGAYFTLRSAGADISTTSRRV